MTARERSEMRSLASAGWSALRIAAAMDRPVPTVRWHCRDIVADRRNRLMRERDKAAMSLDGLGVEELAERWGMSIRNATERMKGARRRASLASCDETREG